MNKYELLNPMQQEAVYHTEGPLLVLAGGQDPGSDPQDCVPDRRKTGEPMEYHGYHFY